MNIDGLNRGIPANNVLGGGLENLRKTNGPQGNQNVADQQTDLEQLLDATKLLGSQGKLPTDGLPPPPEGVNSAKALAGLADLSDTQVTADIYAFMALFQKLAQQMRDTARTQRSGEMQSQVSALQNAAEKMKDAAAHRLTGAIAQGAMQIAGGVAQAGFSAASISSTVKGAKLGAEADAMSPKAAALTGAKMDAAKFTATGQAQLNYSQASSGISAGLGGIIGAAFTHKGDLADADKANLETQAKIHETSVQHANDLMQQMMDVIRDVRDKLQSIQQASVETNRGIARNI